jgi:uncharacterized protein (TIGR00251 family)
MQFTNPFKIIVRTTAPKTEITGFDEGKGAYKMNVHALPEKGKANMEIIKFFKKKYKLDVKIVSGKTSKQKTLRRI